MRASPSPPGPSSVSRALTLLVACALAPAAAAQTALWIGIDNANWVNPGNWSTNAVPDTSTDVVIAPAPFQPALFAADPMCRDLTISVGASLTLVSGWDLTVAGDLRVDGTLTVSSVANQIALAGDLVVNGTYTPSDGLVDFVGTGTIGGLAPLAFGNLVVTAGVRTALAPFEVGGALTVRDGATLATGAQTITVGGGLLAESPAGLIVGGGTFVLDGTGVLDGGPNVLPSVTVSAGSVSVPSVTVAELVLTGGQLRVQTGSTLHVLGDATLSGGQLGFFTAGASEKVIDVDGDLTITGTTAGDFAVTTIIRCAGDWSSGPGFAPSAGTVELDGGGASTIGGPGPRFVDLRVVDGVRTLTGDVTVAGALLVDPGATLDVADRELAVAGDVLVDLATVLGTGTVELLSDGVVETGFFTSLPGLRVSGGVRSVENTNAASLQLVGGTLRIEEDRTLAIAGDASLSGGVLEFSAIGFLPKTLDVGGDVTANGASVVANTGSARIRCAGDWSSDRTFAMTAGTVELDGGSAATITGPPTFPSLRIVSGTKTLLTDAVVTGALTLDFVGDLVIGPNTIAVDDDFTSAGGDVTGTGWVELTGSGDLLTLTATVDNVRIAGGVRQGLTSTLGRLELTAGTLLIRDNAVVRVLGDADLLGGTLGFEDQGGFDKVLDVDGDVTITGAAGGLTSNRTVIRCAGDWTAAPGFALAVGTVELDGGGATSISGGATLPSLRIADGLRTVTDEVLATGTVTVEAGATLTLGGTLSVGASLLADGGGLAGSGTVEMIGTGLLDTGASTVPNLRVDGTKIDVFTSRCGTLQLAGGELLLRNGETLTVLGDAALTGGVMSWDDTFLEKRLDVGGDVLITGAVVGTSSTSGVLSCGGDWSSPSTFAMAAGMVELTGAGIHDVGGAGPTFPTLVVTAGSHRVDSDVSVTGNLSIGAGAAVELQGSAITVDASLLATSGTLAGPGLVELTGNGTLSTGGGALPDLLVSGGTRAVLDTSAATFTLTGGDVTIKNDQTLAVSGDVALLGGTLGFDDFGATPKVLDVGGDVSIAGTTAGPSAPAVLVRCAGDWSADAGFALASGVVELVGGANATLGGAGPVFPDLVLAGGARTLDADALVTGSATIEAAATLALGGHTLAIAGTLSAGGDVTGTGLLDLTGDGNLSTGAGASLPRVRVSGGLRNALSSSLETLELTGGELVVVNEALVAVAGDALLQGGTLSFSLGGAAPKTLDVDGDVVITGTAAGTANAQSVFRCAGDWASDGGFAPPAGTVEFDGLGTAEIRGTAPGFDPTFAALVIGSGTRRPVAPVTVRADTLDVASGARLDVGGAALTITGNTDVDVFGEVAVGTGGVLALGGGLDLTIATDGLCTLAGLPGAPATITGTEGGGYAFTVRGTIAANHFRFEQMNPTGILIPNVATLGAPPFDLRQGAFDRPASDPGSALLDIRRLESIELVDVDFFDSLSDGTFNVRVSGGFPITFVNSDGPFSGPAFESDPIGVVDWTTEPQTELDGFTATPGVAEIALAWTTSAEVDVDVFGLDVQLEGAAAFAPLVELPASGPTSYAYLDAPVPAGSPRTYRLWERTLDGQVNVLAAATATPLGDPGADFVTVGPGGDFADIGAALASTSNPTTVLLVAAGTYSSFTVDASAPTRVHVLADGPGRVIVDTSNGPVRIVGTGTSQLVELSDLTIGSAASGWPGVEVDGCAGAVVLDDLVVVSGAGQPAVDVVASDRVVVQRSSLAGAPGLAAGDGADVLAGGSTLSDGRVAAGGTLRTCEVDGAITVSPGGSLTEFAGVMPDLDLEERQPVGSTQTASLTADAGAFAVIFANLGPGWFDARGKFQMAAVVDIQQALQLPIGTIPAGPPLQLGFDVPSDAALLGTTAVVQPVVQLPASPKIRWGNVTTLFFVP